MCVCKQTDWLLKLTQTQKYKTILGLAHVGILELIHDVNKYVLSRAQRIKLIYLFLQWTELLLWNVSVKGGGGGVCFSSSIDKCSSYPKQVYSVSSDQ